MILADKIINERKKLGWSQEDLAERLGVSRQSVSKWEGAQAIPDLSKIIKMSEIFNVSTDYLLKDDVLPEVKEETVNVESESYPPRRKVTMDEAVSYLETTKWAIPRTIIGTFLCITCPVVLIALAGLTEVPKFGISEDMAALIGMLFLISMVIVAVLLFLFTEKRTKKFEYLTKELFETEYGIEGLVREKKNAFENKSYFYNTLGVVLCIFCPVPIIVGAFLGAPDHVIVLLVCLLLIIVGVAVSFFIKAGMMNSAFMVLLAEGEYSDKNKQKNNVKGIISGIYWCIITAIFLAISFTSGSWEYSWIVFAVGGVLYAALCGILKLVIKNS